MLLLNLKRNHPTLNSNHNNFMRLQHIIQKVYFDPVCITPAGHAAVRAVIENKLGINTGVQLEEGTDLFGDALPAPYNIGSTRVIPVAGTIGFKVGNIAKSCGVADVQDIKGWINEGLNDASVTGMILSISSPGGGVSGVPELAQYIKQASKQKKIVSFTDDLAASAGYWIAAATDEIYATPSADVGSVGVYSYMLTYEDMFKQAGVTPHLFKDGKYKGMGAEGFPLTDDQKAYLQGEVDKISKMFKGFVKESRSSITDEQMQGQTHMAYEVVGSLVDATVMSIEEIIG
jgi:signal peptide peptidase SppA